MVVVLALAGCGAAPEPQAPAAVPPRPIQVVAAAELRRTSGQDVTGTIRAVRSATLTSRVMGTVVAVPVTLGSRVRAGDVVVRLSAHELDARLAQARALLAHAQLERDRSVKLSDLDAISPAQRDTAVAQLRVAEAARAEAEAMVEQTVVRAPFAGTVTAKLVEVGDTAVPGRALLMVEDPEVLRFEAMVPEGAARSLAPGQTRPVWLLDRSVDGVVAEVGPAADPASRAVLVKLDLPRGVAARPGMFGRLALGADHQTVVVVPQEAWVRRGQLDQVFVVEDGRAQLRLVRAGREHDGIVEVLSGLRAGEAIAITDVARLVDDQPVEVRR